MIKPLHVNIYGSNFKIAFLYGLGKPASFISRSLPFIFFFLSFSFYSALAATKTWTGATNNDWNTGSNWGGTAPAVGDIANIPGGLTNYPIINNTVTIATVNINSAGSGASITVTTGGSFSVTALLTVNANGSFIQNGGTSNLAALTTNNLVTFSGGTLLSTGTITINNGANFNQSGGLIHMAVNTGTNPTDNILIATGGTFTQSDGTLYIKDFAAGGGTFNQTGANALFKVFHDWKPGTGSVFNSTAGTVEFTGSGGGGPNFAAGTRQFSNIIIDAGVDPVFSNTAASAFSVSGDLTNNNATLAAQTDIAITFNGTGTQNIYTAAPANAIASSIIVNKSSGTLNLGSGIKTGALTLTAGNLSTTSNNYSLTTTGNALFSAGTFNMNASTISVTGSWTNNGCTITGGACSVTVTGDYTRSAGSISAPTGAFLLSGNFVNNASGTFDCPLTLKGASKTISGTNNFAFTDVTIGDAGVYTMNISGTCSSLTFGVSANVSTFTLASGTTLTINGDLTINQPSAAKIISLAINAGTVTVNGNVNIGGSNATAGRVTKIIITTGTLNINGNLVYNSASAVAANAVIDMSGGAGNTYLTGNFTLTNTSGTLTPGTTSTFIYNGSGSQTVEGGSAIGYNHLTIDKASGTATLNSAITVNNISVMQGTLDAAGFAITISGNFVNNATLSGTPAVTFSGASKTITGTSTSPFGAIVFTNGSSYTMSSGTYSGSSLTFNAGATAITLTQSSPSILNVNGAVTINQPTASSITIAWNINDATVNVTGLITFAGTNTTTSRIGKIVITTGTLNAYGGMTFVASANATKVIDMSGGAGTLNLKGALTVPSLSGTLTAGTAGSIFNYEDDVNAQTIYFFPAGAYHNLHINNTSSTGASLNAAITTSNVTGNLRVQSGTLNNASNAIALTTGKTFRVSNGATFVMMGTTGMVTGTTISKIFGATSTCEYAGAAQTISNETYGNLTLSGTGIKTMPGSAMTIQGNFTTSGSAAPSTAVSLTIGGNVVLGNGTSFDEGSTTHNIAGDWTNNGATVSIGTSTLNFNGTTAQALGGSAASLSMYNLTISNTSAAVSVNLNTSVSNTLNLNGSATVLTPAASVVISGAGTLTGSGAAQVTRTAATPDFCSQYTITNKTLTNLTIDYSASGDQTICSATYGSLKAGGSGVKTASGAVTVNGTLNISSGIVVDMATNALSGTLTTVTGTGTLKTQNTSSTPVPTGKTWTFTVEYNKSTGAQTVMAGTYTNLTNSNTSGSNTASGDISVSTALLLNSSSLLDMSTFALSGTLSSISGTGTLKTQNTTSTPIPTGKTWTGPVYYNSASAQTIVNGNYTSADGSGGNRTLNSSGTIGISSTFTTGAGTYTVTGSTVDFNGNGAQNIPAFTFNNVTVSGSGTTKTATGAVVVNGTLNISSNVILDMSTFALSGTLGTLSGTGTLKTQNTSATPITSGKTWPYAVYYNSSSAQTIVTGNYNDLNGTGGNRTFATGTTGIAGTFTPGAGTYTTTGTTIDFNGSGAQSIPAFTFEGVTFSGGNTKTAGGNITVTNVLTLGASTTLALGSNNITLTSTATNTARIASVPASAAITYGAGRFIIQRYIPGRRKYRLITSSVTTSAGATLTGGQEGLSIWGNWQNQGNNVTTHSGTIITGGTSGDGFDQHTTNASMYTYDAVNRVYVGFSSANSKNTKYTPLKAGVAYYLFVYGDRINTVYTNTPNYTTLTSTGTILTGDQTYNSSSTIPLSNVTDRYTMLGNPFASPIDWASVQRTNLYNTYWGWDPNLNSTGGYVTVSTAGGVTLISPFTGTTGLNQYIQPGQGFFVRTSAPSPVLIIREQDKVSNINLNAFRVTNNIPLIAVNLLYKENGNTVFADGALAAFDGSYSNSVNKEDAEKMLNTDETVAIKNSKKLLSIDARQMPVTGDTLSLNISKINRSKYTLQVFAQKLDTATTHAYLVDTYEKTSTPLSLSDTNYVDFNVNAEPASFSENRFYIVFKKSTMQPVLVEKKTAISVYPNPLKGQLLTIGFTEVNKGLNTIRLVNALGQVVFRQTIEHDGSVTKKTFVLQEKPIPGIYHLQVTNKDQSFNKNIVIE